MEISSVRNNFSELTFQDIEKLIDITANLRVAEDQNQLIPILKDIEAMLKFNGAMLGIYDTQSSRILFSVATLILNQPYDYVFDSTNPHFTQNKVLFKQQTNEKALISFFYLDCFEEDVSSYHLEIFRILLQQLHAAISRFYNLTKQFTSLGLTDREMEVLQWVGLGKDNWSIGKILGVSERTIKFHCKNIFRKFGVNSKLEAISYYHTKLPPNNTATLFQFYN